MVCRSGRHCWEPPPRIIGLIVPLRQDTDSLVALREEELFNPRPGILHGHSGSLLPPGHVRITFWVVLGLSSHSLEITYGMQGRGVIRTLQLSLVNINIWRERRIHFDPTADGRIFLSHEFPRWEDIGTFPVRAAYVENHMDILPLAARKEKL